MNTVEWKIHLNSSPELVFEFLTTSIGREKFWAEKAQEKNGFIHFVFPNGETYESKVIHSTTNSEFQIDYFNSIVKFVLVPTENNGTDLTMINEEVSGQHYLDVHSSWVSVLLNLKAAVDFGCDLRNHNKNKTWKQKFADN